MVFCVFSPSDSNDYRAAACEEGREGDLSFMSLRFEHHYFNAVAGLRTLNLISELIADA